MAATRRLWCSRARVGDGQHPSARKLARAGVDIIIGHHSHTVQPVERYHDSLISYGLGNFIFPDVKVNNDYIKKMGWPANHVVKSLAWNRASIGLAVSLEDLTYLILPFFFSRNTLELKKWPFHYAAHLPLLGNSQGYLVYGRVINSINVFFRRFVSEDYPYRPKWPGFRRIAGGIIMALREFRL